ncbi:MAG TPA: alanine racemase [Gemmatimonadales bacterium]|nr:alanine racemase [Gemmatimonadales bacterium]
MSRSWLSVDLRALLENARTVARVAGAPLLPMIKADGYGLGAGAVARALEVLDPWGFGVASIEEGAQLRQEGLGRWRLMVFSPAQPQWFPAYQRYHLTPVFDDAEALREWLRRDGGPFHLEIDTGMSRTGVRLESLPAWTEVLDTPAFEGCFTQFHSADRDERATLAQWEELGRAVQGLRRRPSLVHASNSAGALRGKAFAGDLVRPGLFLYGGLPGEGFPVPRPVAHVRAQVLSVRRVAAGDTVSYGATWTAARATTIATLGIGYADGVRPALSRARDAFVLLNGRSYPCVGAVTMDLIMIDVGDDAVERGQVATLLGSDGERFITLAQFAEWSDESQYAILTGLSRRLVRTPAPQ